MPISLDCMDSEGTCLCIFNFLLPFNTNTFIIIWSISYTQCSQSNSIIFIHIINPSKRIYATFFPEMKGNMLIQKAFLKKSCRIKIFSKLDNLKLKRRTRSKVQSLKNKCHPSSWCVFWAVIFFSFLYWY